MSELKTEIDTDPIARGYSGMTDQEVVDSLNDTIDREVNKSSLTGDEVFQATNAGEYNGLSDAEKSQWLAFCGRETINPFGSANVTFVTALMGASTVSGLQALRKETVSRGVELGFGNVKLGHVQDARI